MGSALKIAVYFFLKNCHTKNMARNLRIEYSGAIYHVTSRMLGDWRTEQNLLFKDDADRKRFMDRLAERVEQFNIRLYVFVLMKNHFHLVFETPQGNCSKFMHSLCTAYTVYYNLRHKRHGHLLDGRYKAKLVEGDSYLLSLSRYVHLNPVRIGEFKTRAIKEKINLLREYPWSSYQSYIDARKRFEFVEYGPILAEMEGQRRQWARQYQKFVESGLAEDDEDFKIGLRQSSLSLGSESFMGWVHELYEDLVDNTNGIKEDIFLRDNIGCLNPEVVIGIVSAELNVKPGEFNKRHRNSLLRAIAARFLCQYTGLTQREMARMLKMSSGSAVSQQMKKLSSTLPEDRVLARGVKRIEQRLQKERNAKYIV